MKTTTARARETDDFVLSLKARLANAKNHGNYTLRATLSELLRKTHLCFALPVLIVFLEIHQIISVSHEKWQDVGINQDTWKVKTWNRDNQNHQAEYVSYLFSISNGKRLYMYESRREKLCFRCSENNRVVAHWTEIPYDLQIETTVLQWERSHLTDKPITNANISHQ